MRLAQLISLGTAMVGIAASPSHAASLAGTAASADTTVYQDPETGFTFSQYFGKYSLNNRGITFRIAIPSGARQDFDVVIQIVAPSDVGWAGLAWGGGMLKNPLATVWGTSNGAMISSRWAEWVFRHFVLLYLDSREPNTVVSAALTLAVATTSPSHTKAQHTKSYERAPAVTARTGRSRPSALAAPPSGQHRGEHGSTRTAAIGLHSPIRQPSRKLHPPTSPTLLSTASSDIGATISVLHRTRPLHRSLRGTSRANEFPGRVSINQACVGHYTSICRRSLFSQKALYCFLHRNLEDFIVRLFAAFMLRL